MIHQVGQVREPEVESAIEALQEFVSERDSDAEVVSGGNDLYLRTYHRRGRSDLIKISRVFIEGWVAARRVI